MRADVSKGKQMSSFVLERLVPILQITGVKIVLIHGFIPHGDAACVHKPLEKVRTSGGAAVFSSLNGFVFHFNKI